MLPRIMLAAVLLALLAACATSPTGRRQLLVVSDAEVNQMGLATFQQMKATDKLSTDAKKRATAECIVGHLVRQLPEQWQAYQWEVQVFAIDSANAFALPGGKVGLNTGLFRVASNQDQLAAVVGHEIGHVIARHSNERLSQSVLAEAWSAPMSGATPRPTRSNRSSRCSAPAPRSACCCPIRACMKAKRTASVRN